MIGGKRVVVLFVCLLSFFCEYYWCLVDEIGKLCNYKYRYTYSNIISNQIYIYINIYSGWMIKCQVSNCCLKAYSLSF